MTGQIDLPGGAVAGHPVVLMVPGGWFMDRDGYMGGSGTERDLIYRDLANDFLRAGLAVVRYDNRGVHCNEMTMPCCPASSSELEVSRHYLNVCVDADMRQTVTVQTQMDDVEDVWQVIADHPALDAQRILVWAHSEGALNVARLIGRGRIDPQGVQFVGAITESPAAIFRWQTIERYLEHVMDWDQDGDGFITQADVDRHFPDDQIFAAVGISSDVLAAPDNGWNRTLLHELFAAEYETMRTSALAKPDDAPYPEPSPELRVVAASNNWWKQWFVDETSLIDHLASCRCRVVFHLGELDSQSPACRQLAFGEERIKTGMFEIAPRLVLHKGRGHSLRTGEPVMGPMDEAAKASLAAEARELLFTR